METPQRDEGKRSSLTTLHIAAANGNADFVEQLLEEGKKELNALTNLGDTPIMEAVANNHPRVVQLFVNAGADMEVRNQSGLTALTMGTKYGKWACVRMLLQGSPRIQAETPEDIEKQVTPILCAIASDDPDERSRSEVVRLLLGKGGARITMEELQAAHQLASQLEKKGIATLLAAYIEERTPASVLVDPAHPLGQVSSTGGFVPDIRKGS